MEILRIPGADASLSLDRLPVRSGSGGPPFDGGLKGTLPDKGKEFKKTNGAM
jgi:hypothetical protein